MKLVCECYGSPPTTANSVDSKRRNTKSKKCNCPFSFRIYCFQSPTELVRCKPKDSSQSELFEKSLSFDKGVYIYEYPLEDHTCGCKSIKAIRQTFTINDDVYNTQSMQGDNIAVHQNEISEEKFWNYAQVLYNTDITQDKAFKILQDLGK